MYSLYKKFVEKNNVELEEELLKQVFNMHDVSILTLDLYTIHEKTDLTTSQFNDEISKVLEKIDPKHGKTPLESAYLDLLGHYLLALVNLQWVYTINILENQPKTGLEKDFEKSQEICEKEKIITDSVIDE